MKNFFLLVKCLLILFGLASYARPVHATDFISTNTFTLTADETQQTDLWLSANRITLAGTVVDDAFLAASSESLFSTNETDGTVMLTGQFHNDVWAMGNTVTLTGAVRDHARLLGRTVTVSGSISNSSIFCGTSVHLTPSCRIDADVWLFGENLMSEGTVRGDVFIMGPKVTLSGHYAQNVRIQAQDIVILPGTEIMGNLTYRAPSELALDSKVKLNGKLIRDELPQVSPHETALSLGSLMLQIGLLLAAILAGVFMLALFGPAVERSVLLLKNTLWQCMLTGLVVTLLLPTVMAALLVTLVGIPLSVILGMGLTILLYLAKIPAAIMLGSILLRPSSPQRTTMGLFAPMVLGLIILYAAMAPNVMGVVMWLLVAFAGVGALTLAILNRAPRPPALPRDRSVTDPDLM